MAQVKMPTLPLGWALERGLLGPGVLTLQEEGACEEREGVSTPGLRLSWDHGTSSASGRRGPWAPVSQWRREMGSVFSPGPRGAARQSCEQMDSVELNRR